MKKMNLNDYISKIDDKYINESISISDERGFRELKKKNNLWIKWTSLAFVSIILIMVGLLNINNSKDVFDKDKDKKEIVISANKYLTANYAMLMYDEATDYIETNNKLDELIVNESITINSNEFMENSDEYQYCKGEIKVTKLESGLIEYNISSSCDNASDEIKTTMKLYSNVNQNSSYQILSDIKETDNGYIALLNNYHYDKKGDETFGYFDGISGFVVLDKDLNIISINNIKDGIKSANVYFVNDGYLVEAFEDETESLYSYGKDMKLLWEKKYDNQITTSGGYVYENDDYYIFCYFSRLVYISKGNGEIIKEKELGYDDGFIPDYIKFNDNLLYKINLKDEIVSLYIYNLDGELIRKIDIPEKISNDDYSYLKYIVNKDIAVLSSPRSIYIFNNEGKLINKVDTDNKHIEKFTLTSDKIIAIFEGIYEYDERISVANYVDSNNFYKSYNYDGKELLTDEFNPNYGWQIMNDLKIINYDPIHYNYDIEKSSYVINNSVIETFYSENDNGTIFIIKYDYNLDN